MLRPLYLAGFGYLAVCAALVVRHAAARTDAEPQSAVLAAVGDGFAGSASQWFAAIKPYCNDVEVEMAQRQHPAPQTLEGRGYSAACYALAGKLSTTRAIIDALELRDRYRAAGIVFDIAHPVADAGDDRAAGPIMELVLDYWPNHYMALYHAGMAEYALKQPGSARSHLESFVQEYHENDSFRRNALRVLRRLR
ncbi:MAG TPA: hypothetical protein VLB49_10855 [Gemmatimonadales bacterium]|nr:hypothetical protein [Gemmatimonadales bacterium]